MSTVFDFIDVDDRMKFDVIIGNPPYQLNVGVENESFSVSIYQLFVEVTQKLKPRYISMIIPARWFSGGRGLDEFRSKMLNDKSLMNIIDYPDASECFPGVQIEGGVCIFLSDSEFSGDCTVRTVINNEEVLSKRNLLEHGEDFFVRNPKYISIVNKNKSNKHFSDLVSVQTPFGIVSSYKGDQNSEHKAIKIYKNGGVCYASIEEVQKNTEWVDKHKVLIPKARGGNNKYPMQVIGRPFYSEPGSACTQTYLVVGPFSNERECENVIAYMKTKFFRFLVSAIKPTQDGMRKVYTLVPQMDMTRTWTDADLYAHFDLEQHEIDFIESMIKEMK